MGVVAGSLAVRVGLSQFLSNCTRLHSASEPGQLGRRGASTDPPLFFSIPSSLRNTILSGFAPVMTAETCQAWQVHVHHGASSDPISRTSSLASDHQVNRRVPRLASAGCSGTEGGPDPDQRLLGVQENTPHCLAPGWLWMGTLQVMVSHPATSLSADLLARSRLLYSVVECRRIAKGHGSSWLW